jgi:hypothetical protein
MFVVFFVFVVQPVQARAFVVSVSRAALRQRCSPSTPGDDGIRPTVGGGR